MDFLTPEYGTENLSRNFGKELPLYAVSQPTHPIPVFLNCRAAAQYRGPGIDFTGPREVLLEFVSLVF